MNEPGAGRRNKRIYRPPLQADSTYNQKTKETMTLNVKPIGDRILVEAVEEKELEKGGIIITGGTANRERGWSAPASLSCRIKASVECLHRRFEPRRAKTETIILNTASEEASSKADGRDDSTAATIALRVGRTDILPTTSPRAVEVGTPFSVFSNARLRA
jgi:hypothetical protein